MTEDPPTATAQNSNSEATNPTGTVFAWVAAILINASFIALVAWGSLSNWAVGFVFAGIYTSLLLVASFFLKRRNGEKDIILTSLLFLLSVIAIAVAGSFLPINLIKCVEYIEDSKIYTYPKGGEWVTDTSSLPSNVQEWWNGDALHKFPTDSFAYLPSSEITFFRGSQANYDNGDNLWKVSSGSAPTIVSGVQYPHDFIVLNDDTTLCFLSNSATIACTTDGDDVKLITPENIPFPRDLYYSDNLIWFRADSDPYHSTVLYSVSPSNTAELTLYSRRNGQGDGEGGETCDENHTNRILFISLLFVSAIPSLILAFVLGYRYKIPSMPFGGYLSLTWAVMCLVFIIDPGFEDIFNFFRWWFVFTSAPWLILLTLAHLTNRMTQAGLTWGINFAGLVYMVGIVILVEVFWEDDFWRWVVFTVLGVFPLIFMSIVTGRILLMVLGSIGLMIDVWRFTAYITDTAGADSNAKAPIQFIVLGFSGLALGFAGYILSKYQSRLQGMVTNWSETNLARWRLSNSENEGDGTEVEVNSIEQQVNDETAIDAVETKKGDYDTQTGGDVSMA